MAYKAATFAEIQTKLRQDFARRLKESGHPSADAGDPVLGILFRTFASQLETLYSDTERIREALLDELISGLGIERRVPRPAQTVVRFYSDGPTELIREGTELAGITQSHARLTFSTDATVGVSAARIAMAAVYQNESLQLLPGLEMPDRMQGGHPSPDPVPARLGPGSAIYVAVENLPPEHLGYHGFFFDISAPELQQVLRREAWRLAGSDGRFGAEGILCPYRRNAGVQGLRWLLDPDAGDPAETDRPALPDGFYAGRIFVFPAVSEDRRGLLCGMPRGLEQPLARIFRDAAALFQEERAWLRISVPPDIPDLHTSLHSIALHAVSASNIVDLNQTIEFEAQGTSVPVEEPERFLVAPSTITGGDDNAEYISAFQSSSRQHGGRYAVRNGRVDVTPAARAGNRPLGNANVPAWVTNGALGNTVTPGNIQGFMRPGEAGAMHLTNPMPAAGGTDGESFGDAHARFASVLLSRARIVTAADLSVAVKAFDRRVRSAEIASELRRTGNGLQRVHVVTAWLDRDEFTDPDEEMRMLGEDLQGWLQARTAFDTELVVECRWAGDGEPA